MGLGSRGQFVGTLPVIAAFMLFALLLGVVLCIAKKYRNGRQPTKLRRRLPIAGYVGLALLVVSVIFGGSVLALVCMIVGDVLLVGSFVYICLS